MFCLPCGFRMVKLCYLRQQYPNICLAKQVFHRFGVFVCVSVRWEQMCPSTSHELATKWDQHTNILSENANEIDKQKNNATQPKKNKQVILLFL